MKTLEERVAELERRITDLEQAVGAALAMPPRPPSLEEQRWIKRQERAAAMGKEE